jgi:diguanylate cyclase (GGDEF)-like protein
VALAAQIQHTQRASDAIARWGGEEFVVVCPNTNLETATALAQRMRELVAKTEIPPAGFVTLSVGVAEYKSPETWQNWLKRADEALYEAKGLGRNQVRAAP